MKIVFTVFLAVICTGDATEVKECSSSKLPISVTIPGCDSPPCKLIKGTNVEVQVEFESANATSSLSPKVITRVLGISIPYDLPNNQKDGCKQLQSTSCPLDPKEFAIYTLSMPILESYPSISIEIELNMIGDDNKSLFCFKVDCKVE